MKRNVLVAYYSHSGNTRKIAELIQLKAGGTLHEIVPKDAYPTGYDAVVKQAKKEIQAGFRPELASAVGSLDEYDTVFVGSPNWWSTVAPPVATFLAGCDLSGKTVVPFLTHGGGGAGRMEPDIARLCPQAVMESGLAVSGDGGSRAAAQVTAWLEQLGIVEK